MRGRFNLFQASMLRWRELHPYCASHVVAVRAAFDEARLRAAIGAVLEACGLTGFAVNARARRFDFEGGAASVSLEVVDGGESPFDVAAAVIERTINQPFPRDGRFDPFRFFAVRDGDGFLLGVSYDHFVAGGDSIAVLLTDIATHCESGDAVTLTTLERYPPTYTRLFARQWRPLLRALVVLPDLMNGWRRAIRPHVKDPADGTNGFVHARLDPEHVAAVRNFARRVGSTQNDVLLALLYRAVVPIAAQRRHTGRRTDIALASIVNVRADFQPPATEAFGQFLSSFRVVHRLSRDEPLESVVRAITRQTSRAKQGKLYLMTLVAMGAAALLWRLSNRSRRERLYLKYHPVFAGLTPLNVDALRRSGRSREADYLRAASTGPMSPMVVAVTTAGTGVRIGITYRVSALSREDVARVVDSLVEGMETLL
jgi:hypothetical protein